MITIYLGEFMKLQKIKFIMNQFYNYTHIPLLFIKDKETVFPELDMSIELRENLLTYIPILKYVFEENIMHHCLSDGVFMLGHFNIETDSEVYRLLIGPIRVSGQESYIRKDSMLSFLNKEIPTESEEAFKKDIEFILMALNVDVPSDLSFKYFHSNKKSATNKKRYLNILNARRLENFTKDSYQMELRVLHYIKTQQLDKIKWTVRSLEKNPNIFLSKNEIKNLNYKLVSFIAIATRTVVNDGIPIETAFSLSDSLIESSESLTTARQIIDFFVYTAEHFMLLYQKNDEREVSPVIKQVYNYIDTHLFEKITLNDIAESINMSRTYLSSKFKKETNKGLNQYILERRIEEAKEMLLFTNYSFQEISTQLNFSSQSYFIKCFKEVTELTPKQYKDAYWDHNIWS